MSKKVLSFAPEADPSKDRIDPEAARVLIRECLRHGDFSFSPHAMKELANDKLDTADAVAVLRAGKVLEPELEKGSWRYVVQSNRMSVVIAFRSKTRIVVVTAWRMA